MRPQLLLLALALGCCSAAVTVRTGEELLAALEQGTAPQGPASTVIELAQNVSLSAPALSSYRLPFILPSGRTLVLQAGARSSDRPPASAALAAPPCTIRPCTPLAELHDACCAPPVLLAGQQGMPGADQWPACASAPHPHAADGPMRRLDLGGAPELLLTEAGSQLEIHDLDLVGEWAGAALVPSLNRAQPPGRAGGRAGGCAGPPALALAALAGAADSQLGEWPDKATSPTVIQMSLLWPTIGHQPGSAITVTDSLTHLRNKLCTPALLGAQVAAFRQMADQMVGGASDVYTNGTLVLIADYHVAAPILSATTKLQGGRQLPFFFLKGGSSAWHLRAQAAPGRAASPCPCPPLPTCRPLQSAPWT